MSRARKLLTTMLARIAGHVPDRLRDRWVAGAAAGVGVTGLGASSLLSMLGLSAVTHSSGAAILTGAGGYIAGTYGTAVLVGWLLWLPSLILFAACAVVGTIVLLKRKWART